MSDFNSKLNAVVFIAICAALLFVLSRPREYPTPLDDPWFKNEVIARAEPVLVKFGAEWCGPCRAMEPALDQIENKLRGQVAVVRVNVDEHPDLARHYNVSSIPQVFLFNQGKVVAERVGFSDENDLLNWVKKNASN